MWKFSAAIAVLALAGCAPPVPDSGAGVGFDDYSTYELRRQQQQAANRARIAPGPVISSETTGAPVAGTRADAGAAAVPATPQIPPAAPAPATVAAAPAAPVPAGRVGISDEQDFGAVTSRETIQSDKDRIAQNRAAYQQVQPTALPERPSANAPSIVEFALSTSNQRGQPLYSRSTLGAAARFNRACAKFTSSDKAQEAFLAAGGPDRDRLGVDPDGDGFACFWDPEPFRKARSVGTGGRNSRDGAARDLGNG